MKKKETQQTMSPVEEAAESKTQAEETEKDKAQPDAEKSRTAKTPLEEKEKEIAELKDSNLRLQAETENFKRRMRDEKAKDIRFANERLIKELLPLYENLDRALAAPEINIQSLKLGVDMIFKEFTSFLEKEKVKPISSVGETFDPAVHEALSQIESNDHEDQTVIQEISKGFLINDRVLCPARVVISKKPSESAEKKQPEVKSVSVRKKSGEPSKDEKPKAEKQFKAKNHKDKQ